MPTFPDPYTDSFPDPLDDLEPWDHPLPAAGRPPGPAISREASGPSLTPAQIEAAANAGPILVLAGAGTGKTSTLAAAAVQRILTDRFEASRILAVTFTNKAANQMAARIRASLDGISDAPSWIGTYHGLAARQLREEPEVASLHPGFEILDADDSCSLVKRTLKALNLASGEEDLALRQLSAHQGHLMRFAQDGRDPLKIMCNRISKFKDNLMTPQGAGAWVEARITDAARTREQIDARGLRAGARVYAHYQARLREANSADFGDLIIWPTLAMQRSEDYRDRWASRFDCILADEYQDVNFAQYCWLKALAADHRRLFAVGDDDQGIYSWRGSDIAFIRRFAKDFPGAAQVRLEENFRSTGHILAAANAVIAKDKTRLGKTLFTKKEPGTKIEIAGFRDAQAEAIGIASEIQQRHADGALFEDMAILYRNNWISRGFEEALMRARIPYVIVGDVGFYQRAEIKDVLAFLRLAATPNDRQSDEAFRRVINEPRRGFGAKAMDVLEAEARFRQISLLNALDTAPLPPRCHSAGLQFADAIRKIADDHSHTLADQLSLLLDVTGYRAMLRESKAEETEDRLENLQELLTLAGSFHTARELLDHAALATSRPNENETERVRLMTLHKAKGLEFPQVFLPAWESGTFPSDYGDADEERRLAYVALTRGKRRIAISHCEFRRGTSVPSAFIGDIPDENRVCGWLRDQTLAGSASAPAHTNTTVYTNRFRRFQAPRAIPPSSSHEKERP